MATYNAIPDNLLDPDDPLTSDIAFRWRDNPIAMGQADPTVPLDLLPTVLLGTLTTTSGTTQTLGSLDLTRYRFLRITLNQVSFSATPAALLLASKRMTADTTASAGTGQFSGSIILDLATGIATSMTCETVAGNPPAVPGTVYVDYTGYSTATTSIVFTGGTFDAGSILVYGEK